jgi:hypothetical protein
MNDADTTVEQAFSSIGQALDEMGSEYHVAYLAKLALLLCEELGDPERIRILVETAKRDLADE